MQKSSDFVGRWYCPILSSNTQHVLFLTIKSANFLDIGRHGDCLQWEMNIYLSYVFWLLLYYVYFWSLDAEKNNASIISICVLLLCIPEASWYRTKLQTIKSAMCHGNNNFIGQFSRATKPRQQKLAIFIDRLTSVC